METLGHAPPQAINGMPARWIVAAMIGVAFTGSGLITPLYAIYQRTFDFPVVTLTLVYAAYALGNLTALLFFGKASDCVGRRIVGVASVALGCASMLLFLFATGTAWLFLARILSGIAVGLASGAGTAWLADLDQDRSRATRIALGGYCWGLGIRGSLQIANEIAPSDRRGEVASTYYVAGFVGNSIPVIGVGLITAASNSWIASLTFGCTIAAFAIAAILVGVRYRATP